MKRRDLVSSLFFLAVGVLFIVGSFSHSVWSRFGPGPGFFPFLLGIGFSILSLLLFIVSIFRKEQKEDELPESDSLNLSAIHKTIIYLCLLLGFLLLFDPLGFLLTIFLFMIGSSLLFSKRSLKLSLSVSVLTPILTYVIFVRLLGVQLPAGVLENVIRFY